MKIRIATSKDAKSIQKIYAYYVQNTNITFEYDAPNFEEIERRINNTLHQYPYLVAIENGEVIGYAYASRYSARKAFDWDCELSIYIKDGLSRKGCGTRLYKTLLSLLKKMNVKNVYACITHPNANSERFHEVFGFQVVGIFQNCGYKFKKWHDVVWLEKKIGDYHEVSEFIPFSALSSTEIELSLNDLIQE